MGLPLGRLGVILCQVADDLLDFRLRQLRAVGHHFFHYGLPAGFTGSGGCLMTSSL